MPRLLPTFGLRQARPDERMSVVDHLDELRRRLFVSVAALVVAFVAMWVVHAQLLDILQWPIPGDQGQKLTTLSPTEPFFLTFKVVLWASILVALPVWLYQLYAFVIPALTQQSRRTALAVVGGVSSLFAGGVAFGYFVVLPVALRFLLSFGEDTFQSQLRAGDYFSFVITMLLAAGLLFEVPVAMLALARLGVVTAGAFRRNWRVAIVAIAAIAAVLPGGDPLSMILLMIPQLVLYQVGIWLASAFGGDPLWTREAWASDDEPEPTS